MLIPIKMTIIRDFFFFGLSGLLGFLIDSSILYLLKESFGLFVGRLFSFISAVFATWLFNRSITFKGKRSGLKCGNEFVVYFLLMLFGGAVNYSVYTWIILQFDLIAEYPIIGIGVGSIAGMIINLSTSKFILFRRNHIA